MLSRTRYTECRLKLPDLTAADATTKMPEDNRRDYPPKQKPKDVSIYICQRQVHERELESRYR